MAKKPTTTETAPSLIQQATKSNAGTHADAALLWDQVFDLAVALSENERRILAKNKLSRSRLRVLLILNAEPKKSPSFLAETLGITKASITGLAESLGKQGLIAATPCAEDRRSHTLSITPKGKALLKKALSAYYPKLGEVLGLLSKQEQASLAQILKKWVNGVRKAA